jgi:hypothetical protein
MSALINQTVLARAQRSYDRQEPSEPQAWEPWEPINRPRATTAQVQQFIEDLALTGHYEDEFGNSKQAGPVYHALAIDWVDDKMKIPGTTYLAFERWATAACNFALRGA